MREYIYTQVIEPLGEWTAKHAEVIATIGVFWLCIFIVFAYWNY